MEQTAEKWREDPRSMGSVALRRVQYKHAEQLFYFAMAGAENAAVEIWFVDTGYGHWVPRITVNGQRESFLAEPEDDVIEQKLMPSFNGKLGSHCSTCRCDVDNAIKIVGFKAQIRLESVDKKIVAIKHEKWDYKEKFDVEIPAEFSYVAVTIEVEYEC